MRDRRRRVLDAGIPAEQGPDDLIPTRRSLLARLKRWDDQESWQDFFDTYWKLIYGVATRAGFSDAEAQEVVQDTMVAVARQMPRFTYDPALGSFKTWLFLITSRRITDHLRRTYRQLKTDRPVPAEPAETPVLERIPDPAPGLEAIWDEEWRRQLLDAALQRVKPLVQPAHYQIFDCYVLKEWPVKEVAQAFGVRAEQVYMVKHRVGGLVAKEIQRLEGGYEGKSETRNPKSETNPKSEKSIR